MSLTPAPSNHETITTIMNALLGPEDRRFANWQDQLCRRNQEARGDQCTGFLHEGRYYKPSNIIVQPTVEKKPLHISLHDEMDILVRDKAAIDVDRALIKQSLFTLLYPCTNEQEIRDALPDSLISIMPFLRAKTRCDVEAWTIQDNPRAMRQYATVVARIEMYVAARMIY